jgi:hypothetical protein
MCGCKGCQEIVTIDLGNNIETITQLPTEECGPINSTVKILTCECGITLDIYNSAGILIESTQGGGYDDGGEVTPLFFEITTSTIWESQLGEGYVLTFTYNINLGRWELYYYNDTLDDDILIGIYYTDYSCPTAIQGWDLNCITIGFYILGVLKKVVTWNEQYTNGKKSYSFTSNWSGSLLNYRLSWVPDCATSFPSSGAPANTPAWVLEEETSPGVWLIAGYLFNYNQCPFGEYLTGFGGELGRFSFQDLGVSGYNITISPIDCQCCDEKLTINITTDSEEEIEVIADIVTNEAGDHLIYNGYPYYIFYIGEEDYFLFYLNGQWVVKSALSISALTIIYMESTNTCPFGYYLSDLEGSIFTRFWVRGYNCGDQVEKDFCEKLHEKQCEFAAKTLSYLNHLQFGNTCCEELDNLKNDKRVLEILNCYDTRDIPENTTDYNTIPYIQIKRLLGC